MRKCLARLAAFGIAVALGGCFDVEQSLSLRRNLSGTAGFNMTVDLEPMIVFMAAMQHGLSGKAGEPSAQEIASARQAFLAKQQGQDPGKQRQELAAQKEKLANGLPPGIELLSAAMEQQGTKIVTRLQFGFDDVAKLASIKLPGQGGQDQPAANPYEDPFSSLQLVDEGPTLLFSLGSVNAGARMQEQAGLPAKDAGDPEIAKAFDAALKNMRFAFRLETPFEVVETNATRRDGPALYWEIKASDPDAKVPTTMMARLRK